MTADIHKLQPGDEARLRKIRLRALAQAPSAFASTAAEVAARPPESWVQQLRDLPTWVGVDSDGVDVGLVRAADDPKQPGVAWLISMWVAPGARGTGLSDRLVETVIGWAEEQGKHELQLGVGDHNAHAIALYERHGFVPSGLKAIVETGAGKVTEHDRVLRLHPGRAG